MENKKTLEELIEKEIERKNKLNDKIIFLNENGLMPKDINDKIQNEKNIFDRKNKELYEKMESINEVVFNFIIEKYTEEYFKIFKKNHDMVENLIKNIKVPNKEDKKNEEDEVLKEFEQTLIELLNKTFGD